jgi:hypothetical protein
MFLLRHPSRLALSDLLRRKMYARTKWAIGVALVYFILVCLFLFLALRLTIAFLVPLCVFIVLGAIQFATDMRGKGRSLLAEVSGATALSIVAAEIVFAGGGTSFVGWMASAALALYSVGAIFYASTRLKLERGVVVSRASALVSAIFAWAVILGETIIWQLPAWLAAVFTLVMARAYWGLSNRRKKVRAVFVGMQEVGYSLLVVAAEYLTFRLR